MVWVYCALAFVMDFCGGIVTLAIQLLGVYLKATNAQIGLIGAMGPLGYALLSLCNPRVSGRIGRENSALVGAVLYLVAAFLIPVAYYTHSIAVLLLVSAIAGIAIGFYWPAVQALMGTSAPPEKLLTFITIYNIAWSTGRMLGMRTSGILFMHSPSMPFIVGGTISIAVALATLSTRLVKKPVQIHNLQGSFSRCSAAEFDDLVVASAQLGNLLRTLSVGTAVALFPKWALLLGFNPAEVSGLIFLLLVGHVLSFLLAPSLYAWINPRMLIGIKIAITFGAIFISLSNTEWQFALSFLFVGMCAGLACTASTYYSILSQGSTTRGSARHEASVGGGSVLGPILGGLIAQATGSQRSPYLLMSFLGICLVAIDLAYLLRRRARL